MAKRKPKADLGKRAISPDSLVHSFYEKVDQYGVPEHYTHCGIELWEFGFAGPGIGNSGWKLVAKRPITCVACASCSYDKPRRRR